MIEVLLVLALSFVGLLGLLSLQVIAVRANGMSRGMTEAVGLAQDKLETLEHTPMALMAASTETGINSQGRAVAGGGYTRVVTLAPSGAGTSIHVQVSWTDTSGRGHQVNLYSTRAP